MHPKKWQKVERIYNAAIEREPDARGALIERECAGDEALRREVESLLGYQPEATDLLAAPVRKVIAERVADGERAEIPGRQIGNYRILSRLCAGGIDRKSTRLN